MRNGNFYSGQYFGLFCATQYVHVYTQGEVTSQNLWSRYDRHCVGLTWHNVWS